MILSRFLFSSAIFSVALLAGFKAGEKFDIIADLFSGLIDESALPGVPIPDNNQFNLLIIGADDAEKSDGQLESIWLVAHADDTSKVTLIPVFPSPEDPVQNLILAEAFNLENGEPGDEFWDAMRNTNLWWKGYIITDMSATIHLIDMMGGIRIHDRLLNGTQAVSSVPPWESDSLTAVKYQMLLLAGLCNQIAENQTYNLTAVSELILYDIRPIATTSETFTNLTVQLELRRKLTCTFPTLGQATIQSIMASP